MRKKRVFVKRDETEAAPAPVEEAPDAGRRAGRSRAEELAARDAEENEGAGADRRASSEEVQQKQEQATKRKTKKEKEAEEAAAEGGRGSRGRRGSAPRRRRPREGGRGRRSRRGEARRPKARCIVRRRSPAKSATRRQEERRPRSRKRRRAAARSSCAAMSPAAPRPPAGASRRSARRRHDEEGGEGARGAGRARSSAKSPCPETITVADLAHKMSVKAAEVIKALMKLGQMVTINQVLDQETAMIVVEEMGHKAMAAKLDDPDALLAEARRRTTSKPSRGRRSSPSWATSTTARPRCSTPSAARAWRAARRAASRSTSARTTSRRRKGVITFLDTPGHEAFTAMRARGAKVTDIVDAGRRGRRRRDAADEGSDRAREGGQRADRRRDQQDRQARSESRPREAGARRRRACMPEEYGGEAQFIPVSAKTGEGIDELLDAILLQAEVLELKAPKDAPAQGHRHRSRASTRARARSRRCSCSRAR